MLRFRETVCLVSALAMSPLVARAQSGLTIWAGLGYSSTEGNVTLGKSAKQVSVQLGLPIIPIAIRGDALLFGGKYDFDALSLAANAVVQMRLPFIQPYAIFGRGRYATSLTDKTSGWNYGAGVRIGQGRFGFFAEMRRHAPIGRSVSMFGVTF